MLELAGEARAAARAPRSNGRRDEVQDFLVIEDFSYASKQIFSMDRWTLSGEAAGFIDALYSPGSDFIAYCNSFGGDLICRDLDGEDIEERLDFFNFFFFQLFDPTICAVQGPVPVLRQPAGDARPSSCTTTPPTSRRWRSCSCTTR